MTVVSRDLAKMEDILKGSGAHLKSGGRITFVPQHGKEQANVAIWDNSLNLCKALRSEDANKWEAAMQEYDSLMANSTWKLTNLPKDRKSVGCK